MPDSIEVYSTKTNAISHRNHLHINTVKMTIYYTETIWMLCYYEAF